MSSQKVTIAKNFSCHAFNADLSQVALSCNNDEIKIFNTGGEPEKMTKWGQAEHTLDEHSGFVSAIDWHPETNLIVTSGHDRNAYVWKYDEKAKNWTQDLVILRINRAATSVRWSPSGKKFAVTSGAKIVPVCKYEEENRWWTSKMIKKHKSTVLCIAWSPCSKFVITGSTDYKCRIFCAVLPELDDADSKLNWEGSFGDLLVEYDDAKAWVQGVSWSPDSMQVAFTGHGSTSHFVELDAEDPKASLDNVQTIYSQYLPNLTCDFMTDDKVIMTGFDMNPHLYTKDGGKWAFKKKLDPETDEEKSMKKSQIGQSRQMFQNISKQGQTKDTAKNAIKTFHKNTILGVQKISETRFSTCGVDGRILIWDM